MEAPIPKTTLIATSKAMANFQWLFGYSYCYWGPLWIKEKHCTSSHEYTWHCRRHTLYKRGTLFVLYKSLKKERRIKANTVAYAGICLSSPFLLMNRTFWPIFRMCVCKYYMSAFWRFSGYGAFVFRTLSLFFSRFIWIMNFFDPCKLEFVKP